MSTSSAATDHPSPANERLPIPRCRELLPDDCPLDTAGVKDLRDWMYAVGDALFDLYASEARE